MPNFNYGKPRGSPTALSLLIAPVSKLCRLHVEQRGGECPTMGVWEFIFRVSLRAAFLKCFVPLPMITKRGDFFFARHSPEDEVAPLQGWWKKKWKKKRALRAWLHLRCRAQRCILWSLSSHSEGGIIWGAWDIMNGWYSREDETPWERGGEKKGSLGMRRQENRLWRESLTEEI